MYLLESTDLKGRSIRSVDVFGEENSVTTWTEALDTIAESIYNRNPDFIDKISNEEWLSKIIRRDASAFSTSVEILETGYFVDTGNDTNTKLRIINALGTLFGLTQDDIKAELTADKHIEEDEG